MRGWKLQQIWSDVHSKIHWRVGPDSLSGSLRGLDPHPAAPEKINGNSLIVLGA
jgi:hypothetical protein